jgi:aspartyl/glutamyl-tRNA(Asn/Gln) amidotransferase C subunit
LSDRDAGIKIDSELVRKMAALARVNLSDAEVSRLEGEFRQMLGHFSSIGELGKEGEQLFYVAGTEGALRQDRPQNAKTNEEADAIVGQFSRKEGRLLLAPKSLD